MDLFEEFRIKDSSQQNQSEEFDVPIFNLRRIDWDKSNYKNKKTETFHRSMVKENTSKGGAEGQRRLR
jgi:hypothetical protein